MVIELTNENKTLLNSPGTVFVDFYAVWCGPCTILKPIFHKVAELYSGKAQFFQANVDDVRDIAIEKRISSIPTILCLHNGKVIWSHTGTLTEAELSKAVEQHTEQG